MKLIDVTRTSYSIEFDYNTYDDACDRDTHVQLLDTVLSSPSRPHFYWSASGTFAPLDGSIMDSRGVMFYVCCYGGSDLYEQDLQHVFSITVSTDRYLVRAALHFAA